MSCGAFFRQYSAYKNCSLPTFTFCFIIEATLWWVFSLNVSLISCCPNIVLKCNANSWSIHWYKVIPNERWTLLPTSRLSKTLSLINHSITERGKAFPNNFSEACRKVLNCIAIEARLTPNPFSVELILSTTAQQLW